MKVKFNLFPFRCGTPRGERRPPQHTLGAVGSSLNEFILGATRTSSTVLFNQRVANTNLFSFWVALFTVASHSNRTHQAPLRAGVSLLLRATSCYIVDSALVVNILLADPRLPLCLFRLMKNDSSSLIEFYSFLAWSTLRGRHQSLD